MAFPEMEWHLFCGALWFRAAPLLEWGAASFCGRATGTEAGEKWGQRGPPTRR
jgi:hypothetical protein